MSLAGRIGMPNVHDAGALCAQDCCRSRCTTPLALVAASMCTAAISSLEGSAVIADYVFRFRSISGGYASLQWLSRALSTSRGRLAECTNRLQLAHFRTAGFPQYGWKAGFPSGAFLDDQRHKPAPGMRRPTSSLHPPFVRLVVSTIVPLCVGSPTRLRTAVEVITPPPQGPSLKSGL